MAHFICKCGTELSNSSVPNDIEYRVYSDYEWDDILTNDVVRTYEIPLPKYSVWKCTNCERVHIFSRGGERIKSYVLEDNY